VLRRLAAERDCVVPVLLKRNCGQSGATAAGFAAARGRVVFTIDADLQNDPADMPEMLRVLEETGADAVCGIRANRRDTRVRLISSRIANRVRRWLLGDSLRDTGCALKCFRREFVRDLPSFNGLHRFLGVLLEVQGAKVEQMAVNHRPRTRGVSKYGIGNRLWRGIRDLYGVRWLRDRWVRPEIEEVVRGDGG
jgi:dolichol-phosphate mannosyltransferase